MENQSDQNQTPNHSKTLQQEYQEALEKSGIQAANLLNELIELKIMPDTRVKEMADVALEVIKLINSGSEEIVKIKGNVSPKDAKLIQSSPQSPSENSTDNQPEEQYELISNPSPQTSSPKPERKLHIFSILNPEEIDLFYKAIKLQRDRKIPESLPIIAKIKSGLQTRLDSQAEPIFEQANTLFESQQIDSFIVKFVRRYSELSNRLQQLLNRIETKPNHFQTVPEELEKMFTSLEVRMENLATYNLQNKAEIAMLIQLEDIREQLSYWEKQLNQIES